MKEFNLLAIETLGSITYVKDLQGNHDSLPKNGFTIEEFINVWQHNNWLAWQVINENCYGVSA